MTAVVGEARREGAEHVLSPGRFDMNLLVEIVSHLPPEDVARLHDIGRLEGAALRAAYLRPSGALLKAAIKANWSKLALACVKSPLASKGMFDGAWCWYFSCGPILCSSIERQEEESEAIYPRHPAPLESIYLPDELTALQLTHSPELTLAHRSNQDPSFCPRRARSKEVIEIGRRRQTPWTSSLRRNYPNTERVCHRVLRSKTLPASAVVRRQATYAEKARQRWKAVIDTATIEASEWARQTAPETVTMFRLLSRHIPGSCRDVMRSAAIYWPASVLLALAETEEGIRYNFGWDLFAVACTEGVAGLAYRLLASPAFGMLPEKEMTTTRIVADCEEIRDGFYGHYFIQRILGYDSIRQHLCRSGRLVDLCRRRGRATIVRDPIFFWRQTVLLLRAEPTDPRGDALALAMEYAADGGGRAKYINCSIRGFMDTYSDFLRLLHERNQYSQATIASVRERIGAQFQNMADVFFETVG